MYSILYSLNPKKSLKTIYSTSKTPKSSSRVKENKETRKRKKRSSVFCEFTIHHIGKSPRINLGREKYIVFSLISYISIEEEEEGGKKSLSYRASPFQPGYDRLTCMSPSFESPHFLTHSHRRTDNLQRMRLRVEDESVRAPVTRDLEGAVLGTHMDQPCVLLRLFWGVGGKRKKYIYLITHGRVDQIRVLQDLGEQEALLHVEEGSPLRGVDVRDG